MSEGSTEQNYDDWKYKVATEIHQFAYKRDEWGIMKKLEAEAREIINKQEIKWENVEFPPEVLEAFGIELKKPNGAC